MRSKKLTPPPQAERERYVSAAEYAYESIHKAIVQGQLAPGHRVRENEMAAWLGISRTPLRHALSRLEADWLVEIAPRVGLVVASLDDDAVAEIYEVRESLEGMAAAFAAKYASPRDIDALNSALAANDPPPADGVALYRLNRSFHKALYTAAHNRFLLKTLAVLHDSLALLGPTTLTAAGRAEAAQKEHAQIVRAIAKGDPVKAEAEARAHIRNGLTLRKSLRSAPKR